MNPRYRFLAVAGASLVIVWILAWTGYKLALESKMTAEKVRAFMLSVPFDKLSPEERAKYLEELAKRINKLPPEERRRFRLGRQSEEWFKTMSETERGRFIEMTLPSGVKQMIVAFEELPPEKRERSITNAVNRLRQAREEILNDPSGSSGNPPPDEPVMSEELQKKIVSSGLKTFYAESSAQTKAEIAPLLEELQRVMETGGLNRVGRRDRSRNN